MNLTSASNFKCIQRGLPSVFATFCHAFMTFQLIPSRFHGLYSSLTSVLRQIPVGAHLWCRRFFSILGYNPSGFCTCQQLWMYPERFTQRFCDILSRFHDIPADSRQISWVLQQFDHRFEANSSRFSPLVQALLQHFWVQFQCLWHRPAILNALQEFTKRFHDVLPRCHDIPANSRQISWILPQFDHRFEANSGRCSPLVQALLQHFLGTIPVDFALASNFECIQRGLPSVFATFCHAFMTCQLISGSFHGFCSSLTSVLRQIPAGFHLWCRHLVTICGNSPNGFCICQQS